MEARLAIVPLDERAPNSDDFCRARDSFLSQSNRNVKKELILLVLMAKNRHVVNPTLYSIPLLEALIKTLEESTDIAMIENTLLLLITFCLKFRTSGSNYKQKQSAVEIIHRAVSLTEALANSSAIGSIVAYSVNFLGSSWYLLPKDQQDRVYELMLNLLQRRKAILNIVHLYIVNFLSGFHSLLYDLPSEGLREISLATLSLWDENQGSSPQSHQTEKEGHGESFSITDHPSADAASSMSEYEDDDSQIADEADLSADNQLLILQHFERIYSFRYAKHSFKSKPLTSSGNSQPEKDWSAALSEAVDAAFSNQHSNSHLLAIVASAGILKAHLSCVQRYKTKNPTVDHFAPVMSHLNRIVTILHRFVSGELEKQEARCCVIAIVNAWDLLSLVLTNSNWRADNSPTIDGTSLALIDFLFGDLLAFDWAMTESPNKHALQKRMQTYLGSKIFLSSSPLTKIVSSLYPKLSASTQDHIINRILDYSQRSHESFMRFHNSKSTDILYENLNRLFQASYICVGMFLAPVWGILSENHQRKVITALASLEFARVDFSQLRTLNKRISDTVQNGSDLLTYVMGLAFTCQDAREVSIDGIVLKKPRIAFYLSLLQSLNIENIPQESLKKWLIVLFQYISYPSLHVSRQVHAALRNIIASKPADVEKLVPYYISRSIETYPKSTPVESLAAAMALLHLVLPVRHPITLYCIELLQADLLRRLYRAEPSKQDGNVTKTPLTALPESTIKMFSVLFYVLTVVDTSLLPSLLRQIEKLVLQTPAQSHEKLASQLFFMISRNYDYSRKSTLLHWYLKLASRLKLTKYQLDEYNAAPTLSAL